ncbi:hypothetical protein [Streptomyces sp. NBC_01800]|uniref:hypothetical protein n=1 Tax=Streptomyces sp. NBC_01800 TaxID=2975945 RepID=UPI002DD7C14C|nr:hypothetical protein [Streptomyces sp. NBC_01800]WSA65559.1 hypothetical protein OIE65_00015 [Streptomyces sp. NBC_01800]WSA73558.1 hypothetical protein OIE65_46045 [Streptomyces sp. NBC_01800]
MLDLEDLVNRVVNPDVRPLVREAHRCYATGAARAAIVLTWTAVCADLVHKIEVLKEEGEADARGLVRDVERAQQPGQADAVNIMLGVERTILDVAEKLELIDRTHKTQLERLREDRHLCAHPSLRPLGELYVPTSEYARAHMVAALDAVLVHQPSQGRKVLDSFMNHVADPAFASEPDYLGYAFFDRVRPASKAKVVEFAAKFALLQLEDPDVPLAAPMLADRMALCLRLFADRDQSLAKESLARHMPRLVTAEPGVQIATLGRLGDLPAFWQVLPEPMCTLYNTKITSITAHVTENGYLKPDETRTLALVAHLEVRTSLPALEEAFAALSVTERARVIGARPDPYFTSHLPGLLKGVRTFDQGEFIARTAVLPCASMMTLDDTDALLRQWWDNDNGQTWGRAMPGYLATLYTSTSHLGEARDEIWKAYLEELRPYPDSFNAIATGTGLAKTIAAE